MAAWNRALVRACATHPNMRVYDWPPIAKPTWFVSDGVHYTSAGSAARAAGIRRGPSGRVPGAEV